MAEKTDPHRDFLRHTLATLAYRCGKAVRNAPPPFSEFRIGERSRAPGEILAHIGDLLEWALSLAEGQQRYYSSKPLPWDQEVSRFYRALAKLDAFLASAKPLATPPEKLFQGPIADALTHTGQIGMLRRLADSPVRAENYFIANIEPGRVGSDQAAPKKEFD
jgi:hypothetical protein